MRSVILMVMVAMTIAACGGGPEPSVENESTTTTLAESTTTTETGPTSMPPIEPEQVSLVEAATADLAERLGVDPAALTVLSVQEVTWPDGSLGCPQPGMSYTQALVEGFRVTLRHDDRVFDYHAGDDEAPFRCASPETDGGYDFVPPPGFDE